MREAELFSSNVKLAQKMYWSVHFITFVTKSDMQLWEFRMIVKTTSNTLGDQDQWSKITQIIVHSCTMIQVIPKELTLDLFTHMTAVLNKLISSKLWDSHLAKDLQHKQCQATSDKYCTLVHIVSFALCGLAQSHYNIPVTAFPFWHRIKLFLHAFHSFHSYGQVEHFICIFPCADVMSKLMIYSLLVRGQPQVAQIFMSNTGISLRARQSDQL